LPLSAWLPGFPRTCKRSSDTGGRLFECWALYLYKIWWLFSRNETRHFYYYLFRYLLVKFQLRLGQILTCNGTAVAWCILVSETLLGRF
jgi:hypothetical protein